MYLQSTCINRYVYHVHAHLRAQSTDVKFETGARLGHFFNVKKKKKKKKQKSANFRPFTHN